MRYEFFSSSRRLDEVICVYPALAKIRKCLKIRKTSFHTFHNLAQTKVFRGIKVTNDLPEFMRIARLSGVHEPVIEEDGVTYFNLWPRQARGMFGKLSTSSVMKMCNYHLEELGCNPAVDVNEFVPRYPIGIMPRELKVCMQDSDYPPVFFSPAAAKVLEQQGFSFNTIFGTCSLGFYAIPDFIPAKAENVFRYSTGIVNAAILSEFASKFTILIVTAADTVLLDLSNPSTVVYMVGDRTALYHDTYRGEICYDLIAPSPDHNVIVRRLKSARI